MQGGTSITMRTIGAREQRPGVRVSTAFHTLNCDVQYEFLLFNRFLLLFSGCAIRFNYASGIFAQ
jgi:hypothetical protein